MSDFSGQISFYNVILNYIHQRGLEDYDDFSWKLTEKISKEFLKGNFDVKKIIRRISTHFFKMNNLKRNEFYSANFEELVKRVWKEPKKVKLPFNASDRRAVVHLIKIQKQGGSYRQISVDEIDSFKAIKDIPADIAAKLVPLKIKEDEIKSSFAEIIGEPFTQKDWGGELRDLYSNRVKIKGKRVPTAFLLKGPGKRGILTAARCGKNGDQILRLVKAYSARLFIVQYVGKIHPNLIDTLEAHVAYESKNSKRLLFCIIDGIDTARILLAYGKIKS